VYTTNAGQISPSSATPQFSMLAPGSSQPVPYPDNPNGSVGDVAGICNAQGNVFGLMPHPERYVHALQHPQRQDVQGEGQGDGLLLFKNAFEYARNIAAINRNATSITDTAGDISPYLCKGGRGVGWSGDPCGRPLDSLAVSHSQPNPHACTVTIATSASCFICVNTNISPGGSA